MLSNAMTSEGLAPVLPNQSLALDLGLSDGLALTRERIAADDEGKWDTTAFRMDMRLWEGLLSVPKGDGGTHRLRPSPWAVNQFCQRLSIPAAYFKRCPQFLQTEQFNHWIREEETEREEEPGQLPGEPVRWLLRAKGNTVRGVLSERYSRLDNATVLNCIAPALNDRFEVRWLALTDESFHLRVVDPSIGREVARDDRLIVGLHIANSEVGRRSLTIDALVYRLVCTNGLVMLCNSKHLLSRRHLGITEPRFVEAAANAIGEATAASAAYIEQLRLSTHIPVGDVEKTIERLASEANLSQAIQERMKLSLRKERPEYQETVYGLVNAAAEAAKSLPPDDRYDLEVLAGRYIESAFNTRRDREPSALRLAA
jgi:hypothetical protein